MGQETAIYLTNIVLGTILASLMTHYWLRQGRSQTMRYWMWAAWVMTAADVFFAARPELPYWVGRLLPTLLVTIGQAGLFLGAQKTADRPRQVKLMLAVVVAHAVGLVLFIRYAQASSARMVFNGLIWGGLSMASAWNFRHARPMFWNSPVAPASAFLLHGIFHAVRVLLAVVFGSLGLAEVIDTLQIVGDLEVSFFMVALFVSLLIAHLQLRNEELNSAHAELETLSGLLPICAWCKKVRGDDGYWQQVEDYFASRSQIEFTHGMCADCFKEQKAKKT
jgi:hypothetical protein